MKNKIIAGIFMVLFAFTSVNCTYPDKLQSNNIAGYYASNIHNAGYLEDYVQLELHTNFTFKFYWCRYSGNYHAAGIYKVVNDTILLFYQPSKYDTIYDDLKYPVAPVATIDTAEAICQKVHIHSYSLSYCVNERPKKYYYRDKKLLDIDSAGKVFSQIALDYSYHRMFLFFGPHYWVLRKCYLILGRDSDKIVEE